MTFVRRFFVFVIVQKANIPATTDFFMRHNFGIFLLYTVMRLVFFFFLNVLRLHWCLFKFFLSVFFDFVHVSTKKKKRNIILNIFHYFFYICFVIIHSLFETQQFSNDHIVYKVYYIFSCTCFLLFLRMTN